MGFRRIAREQIALAIAELRSDGIPPSAIHASRKSLKRLRALVTCAAPAIGARAACRHDRALRGIARLLSQRRDADVSLETADALEQHYGEEARAILEPLRGHLEEARAATVNGLDDAALADVCTQLEAVGKALDKQSWKGKGIAPVIKGVCKTYQDGRVELRKAFKAPTDERLHEFRKTVQAHWRHMALLSRAWPEAFAVRTTAAHDLSQILGNDHDLAMLKIAAARLRKKERQAVLGLCERRQKALRKLAEPLSRRLFAETERAFTRRMTAYWRLAGRIKDGVKKTGGVAPESTSEQIGSPASLAAKTPV